MFFDYNISFLHLIYPEPILIGIVSFETDVPNKKVTVIGPEGTDAIVMEKLTKWVIKYPHMHKNTCKDKSERIFNI